MTIHLPPSPADELPRLLLRPLVPTEDRDDVDGAIATAGKRWPDLQPSLEDGARLVRAHGVYETAAEALELALVRLPTVWNFHVISRSPTGLACTCARCGRGCPDLQLDLFRSNQFPAATHPGMTITGYPADVLASGFAGCNNISRTVVPQSGYFTISNIVTTLKTWNRPG